ncbi:MAG: MBL fold metallo-hydrolase [Christensenellaceae bacterium]|nr:MBL fold metallo-hydrolase [Christensenellaceae bacterium]
MKVQWIAHSCFKVYLASGKTILFDPFGDTVGYVRETTSADYVLISHDHHDHNSLEHIEEGYKLINTPGVVEEDGIRIEGIEVWHDEVQGAKRGKNIMFKVSAEGLNLLHMGDIGHVLSDEMVEKLGKIDMLFIPVGGTYTVDAQGALTICKQLEPNIIVPMHYKTLFLTLPIDPVFNFTDAAGSYFDRSRLGSNSFELTAAGKKKRSRIIIMENSLDI